MIAPLDRLMSLLSRELPLAPDERRDVVASARQCPLTTLDDVVVALDRLPRDDFSASDPRGAALAALVERISRRLCEVVAAARDESVGDQLIVAAVRGYERLGPASRKRCLLLQALATLGGPAALDAFVTLVCEQPPAHADDASLAFAPLFQHADVAAETLFPRLLAGIAHASTAAVVLDLANYLVRKGRATRHPAADRVGTLAILLGETCRRLARIEEHPSEAGLSPRALAELVGDAVTLVVSLCGALARIGDPTTCGKLHLAMALSHRRVRAEAASALARLGDEAGLDELAALCAEPSVRVRALSYLAELGEESRAAEAHRTPVARAEGELAAWLALPTRFGMAPNRLELVDERTLGWPGYDRPVACFLFRYVYGAGESSISGIGIAGPTTHAFAADLADLPPDEIFAAYAGFDAVHDEIDETAAEALSEADREEWRQATQLLGEGFSAVELVKVGRFFGERHYVFAAKRQGRAGVGVFDGRETEWSWKSNSRRPLGPTETYCIYKGRRLLKAFARK